MRMTDRNHLLAAFLLLALWSAFSIWRYWNSYAIDLAAIYIAGHFAWTGDLNMIYGGLPEAFAVKNAPEWSQVLEAHGITGESGSHYVYSPLWAFVVAPFSGSLDPNTFFNIGRSILIVSLAGSILLVWRLICAFFSPLLFAALAIYFIETTIPAILGLQLAQPQLFVIFLILLAMDRYRVGRDRSAAIALGIAAAVKVTPILLALIFLADRRWRAFWTTITVSGALAVLSFALAGVQPHLTFIETVRWMEALVPAIGLNMTFETVMHQFVAPFTPCERCTDPRMGLDTPWVSILSRLLFFTSLALFLWATAHRKMFDRLNLRVVMMSTAILFFGPLAWMHYYTLVLLLFLGLLPHFSLRLATILAIPFWAGFSQAWMGTRLMNMDFTGGTIPFPQHSALLSLAVLIPAIFLFSRNCDSRNHVSAAAD